MTDSTESTILTRLALLESDAAHRRELIDSRFVASATALQVALTASDKRLDGMNEFRHALDDQSNNMARRTEVETKIKAIEDKQWSDMKAINDKVDGDRRPNYFLGVSALSAVLIMIGGLWTVTGLKIDNAISPIAVSLEAMRTSQRGQDQELTTIDVRIHELNDLSQNNRAQLGESAIDRKRLNDEVKEHRASDAAEANEWRTELSDVKTTITRLNVWNDFLHAKLFPETPAPPMKQP